MKFRIFQVALIFLSLGYASCCTCPPHSAHAASPAVEQTNAADQANAADQQPADQQQGQNEDANDDRRAQLVGADSDIIPIGDSPILGDPSAPVTVVAFSDLQCPFCSRGAETMHQLQKKYPEGVRVVFKHYPLPFHKQAPAASKATIAAGNQGKFWEMHDWLFENRKQLKSHAGDMKEWTSEQANEMGLDVVEFEGDFDAPETQERIDQDMKLGKKVNVRGTPHFFVNGERVVGAKPLPAFETIVKAEIDMANTMQRKGVARADIYRKRVATNYAKTPDRAKRRPNKPKTTVEFVPVDAKDPMRGNAKDPLVTIVEFSDFQCPFCNKVTPTVDKIVEEYPDKVRVVFKQLPLGMHAQAKPAAIASLAAHRQGKFWEMHDKLFENQREMRQHADDFKEWSAGLAKDLGLDVETFKKDFDDPALAAKADDDLKLSKKIGARGTPNFWINGVNLRGAQPYSAFKEVIDEQIAVAETLEEEKGLSGDALYKAVVATNKKSYADRGESEPERKKREKPDTKVDLDKLSIGDAPTKGPKDAPVTIMAFSDFQCPYCDRGGKNMMEAVEKYDDKVRVVFKHYPLPFHKQAPDAAKAAMAAGEQGKFWEMHDLLFDNQRRLKEDGLYEELAKELGLNVSKFKKDMKKSEYQATIDQDMKQGQQVGVRGTPAFFINGTRIVGAQPTAKFESEIKEALSDMK
jgi:protein-disulfide isomerase